MPIDPGVKFERPKSMVPTGLTKQVLEMVSKQLHATNRVNQIRLLYWLDYMVTVWTKHLGEKAVIKEEAKKR